MTEGVGVLIITCIGILSMAGIFIFFARTMINTLNYHNEKKNK